MSWICPECRTSINYETYSIMLFSKTSFPNSTKKRCCSVKCLALAQKQNREIVRKYCEKNNIEQWDEEAIAKKEDPLDEDTIAEIEAKKTPRQLLLDDIYDYFGGQISPQQWSTIEKQRQMILEKYKDLNDNKLRLIVRYAYEVKNYNKKEPTLLFVYLYYDEAKAYYEQRAQKVSKVEKSFEENKIENKLDIHYTQKQRKNKMIDFSTLNMEGGDSV